MSPVVLSALSLLLSGAAALAWVRWRAARTSALRISAQESLRDLRMWKSMVQKGLAGAVADSRWIARDLRDEWDTRRPTPTPSVMRLARQGEAGAEARELLAFVAQDLRGVTDSTNSRILSDELRCQRAFFDSIESKPLTDEQATAVATFDNRVQVVAAAGSGKTSVMVARAAYAIRRKFVPAERILLLAFNKDAAAELQQRVDERLKTAGIHSSGLRASTFHAFGLNVIGKATGRKQRLASWIDGGQDVGMVSRIVDELRERSPDFRFKWDMYRLLFARMADDPAGGEPDAYDYATRATGFRTFNGETVKSQGERMVADFLFLNGVKYEYERPYVHDVADAEHSQYRPDFYYPDVDVWHEHWALGCDGEPPPQFDGYAQGMAWKRTLHQRFGTALIETTWAAIVDQSGFQPLAEDLEAHGVRLDWNPDRPIRGSHPVKHEDLARLMRSFMAHVKSNSLTREDLDRRLAASTGGIQRYRASLFVDLYWSVHDEWQRLLGVEDAIDFEDMLVRAAEHLESGCVDMGFDLVLVDEFQDASQARARLARALVAKPHRYLMAVGDDWQSINRFAGADLSVMTSFADWFGEGPTLRLQTTFRSPQSICDTAGHFVAKNPRQLRKEVESIHPQYGPPVSLLRVSQQHEVPAAVARVLSDLAARVRSGDIEPGRSGMVEVDVLGRYRFERDLLPRSLPSDLRVRFRTVHSSKGLETDFVVLPNVRSGTYGFPSEIVDDPVLALAMSEADAFPHAEERRLFYVALTRARRQVVMVGVQGRESAFVAELLKDQRLELSPLSTVDLSERCPDCDGGVLVTRARRSDGRKFLGCSRFPSCRFTRSS